MQLLEENFTGKHNTATNTVGEKQIVVKCLFDGIGKLWIAYWADPIIWNSQKPFPFAHSIGQYRCWKKVKNNFVILNFDPITWVFSQE